jgi:hypothetical protein
MSVPDDAPPFTDEEHQLAETIVDEVCLRYQSLIPADDLAEMRDYMVDMLLATTEGRRKLAMVKDFKGTYSDEIDRFGSEALKTLSKGKQTA